MKKLILFFALLPLFASAQITPAQDTTALSTPKKTYTPQLSYENVTINGVSYRIPQSYNSTLGKIDSWVTTKYLRAFYAPLSAAADSTKYTTLNRYRYGADTLQNKSAYYLTLLPKNNSSIPTPPNGVNFWGENIGNSISFKGANGFTAIINNGNATQTNLYRLPATAGIFMLNPLTTAGDILYQSANSTTGTNLARRAIGSNGDVLTVSGGVPVWAAPTGGGSYIDNKFGSTTPQANASINVDTSIYTGVPLSGAIKDTIVYIGDSFTTAFPLPNSNYGFANLTASELGMVPVNYAQGGSVLEKRSPLNPLGGTNGIDEAALVHPYNSHIAAVIIALGYNDLRYNGTNYNITNFNTDYATVISTLTGKGYPLSKIVIISPWYCTPTSYVSISGNAAATKSLHLQFVAATKAIAVANGTKYIDGYNLGYTNGASIIMQADSVHWNEYGHRLITSALEASIGYTIKQKGQQIAANNTVQFEKINYTNRDTSALKYTFPLALDSAGNIVKNRIGYINNSVNGAVQAANININGTVTNGGLVANGISKFNSGGVQIATPYPTNKYYLNLGYAGSDSYIDSFTGTGNTGGELRINTVGGGAVRFGTGGVIVTGPLSGVASKFVSTSITSSGEFENTLSSGFAGTLIYGHTKQGNSTGYDMLALYNNNSTDLKFKVNGNGDVNIPGLTASQLVATDGSKNLVSTTVAAIGAVDLTTNQTIAGAKSFTTGVGLVGIGGGTTTLNSANAGATNYSQNIQGKSGTVALLTDIPYQLRITGSGTGAATTISIAHGLSGVTSGSTAIVQPINAASAGISYITTDATNINIIYTVAPASGTNNLSYNVSIKP